MMMLHDAWTQNYYFLQITFQELIAQWESARLPLYPTYNYFCGLSEILGIMLAKSIVGNSDVLKLRSGKSRRNDETTVMTSEWWHSFWALAESHTMSLCPYGFRRVVLARVSKSIVFYFRILCHVLRCKYK